MLKETYLAIMKNLPDTAIKIVVTRTARSALSPSWGLLKDYKQNRIDWDGYTERFSKEMAAPKCQAEMKRIKKLAETSDVYLVCYEKNPPCHRFLLLRMINSLN